MAMGSFPDGFLWGVGTAAHQVEGANDNNDWWAWEQAPGHIKNGDKSTIATDWWHGERYREDFALARSLHLNAHRLSVEWSRIEPREGEWSAEAISFYRRVLLALRGHGAVPLITLHHFTNPRWVMAKGGWETEAIVPLFARFADRVARELGDLCDFWVTVNEPFVYAFSSYAGGQWPPGKKDLRLTFRVLANMVRGHAAAYHALHRVQPRARVGVAHHLRGFAPANPASALDRWGARLRDRVSNRLFFLALLDGKLRFPLSGTVPEAARTQDFVGINYYYTEHCAFAPTRPDLLFTREVRANWPSTAPWFAAHAEPRMLRRFLQEYSHYGLPIYVTENGIFDLGGEAQTRYLVSHLVQVQRAIADGAPVKGYFYWTLTDNFEWAEGFATRFGLFHLDVASQARTPRPSASVYGRIAGENGIPADLIEQNPATVRSASEGGKLHRTAQSELMLPWRTNW